MGFAGKFFRNRFVKKILETNDHPKRIARGVAVGTFIAVSPTIGFQISLALLFAIIIRANRLAAIAMTFVLNPLIFVPPSYWYFPAYYLGTFLLGMDTVGFSRVTYAYKSSTGFFDLLGNLWSLGIEIYGPMFLGSVVIGLPFAILMYHISLRTVLRHRAKQKKPEGGATDTANGGEIVSDNIKNGANNNAMSCNAFSAGKD